MRMAQEYDGWAYITVPLSTLAQLSLFTGFVLLSVTKNVEFATFTQSVMITTVLLITGSSLNIE